MTGIDQLGRAQTAHDDRPPDRKCPRCGRTWPWIWFTPHAERAPGRYRPRWAAPPVDPCGKDGMGCRPVAAELADTTEDETRQRILDVGFPEGALGFDLSRTDRQGRDEAPEAFQARIRARPGVLGVMTCNMASSVRVHQWSPPSWLILEGPQGTGKTTWLAALARKVLRVVAETRRPVELGPLTADQLRYATVRNLHTTAVRRTVKSAGRRRVQWDGSAAPPPRLADLVAYHTLPELIARERAKMRGLDPNPLVTASNARLLFLDEFGDEQHSSFEVKLVERLICYRHGRGLPTVIATNHTSAEFTRPHAPMYGRRVADRLRGVTVAVFGGESWRRGESWRGGDL